MTKTIYLKSEVIEGVTLADLKAQAGDPNTFNTLTMIIESPGGSVTEGILIMLWIEELKELGKHTISVIASNGDSISSMIPLPFAERYISANGGRTMVHNPMFPRLDYANASELEQYSKELRYLEDFMKDVYSEFTLLGKDEMGLLMDKETYITPEEAIRYGMADKLIDIEERPYVMVNNNNNKLNKLNMGAFTKMLANYNGESVAVTIVATSYNTADGKIEITQEDASKYKVGDSVDKEEGSFKLDDGATLVVKEGKIIDITREAEASNEGEAPDDIINIVEKKIAEALDKDDKFDAFKKEVLALIGDKEEKDDIISKMKEEVEALKSDIEDSAKMMERVIKNTTSKPLVEVVATSKAPVNIEGMTPLEIARAELK